MVARFLLMTVLAATPHIGQHTEEVSRISVSPEVLYWRNSDGKPVRATGILYRPETLSNLITAARRETVPVRILQAIEQQTAIVVMWAIPPADEVEIPVSGYHARIMDTASGSNVPPVWETRDASDLRQIDRQTPFQQVGIVAAFPRSAFKPGGVAVIYADISDGAAGSHRTVQVFGEFQETRLRVK